MLLKIIILVIITEALVELICKAEIFERPRNFIKSWGWFTRELLECYYCTSVWIGIIVVILFYVNNIYLNVLGLGIMIHRLSNYLHLVFGILRDHQLDIRINRGGQNNGI